MVDVNNIGGTFNQFEELDKKITIKLLKEKRTSRTYIEGLDKFFDTTAVEKICSNLKKQLGTGFVERDIQENHKTIKIFGFNGDHRSRIKKVLEDAGIDDEKINVKA
jgi:translation initiation factor 1 (eIF-1/SUI1)